MRTNKSTLHNTRQSLTALLLLPLLLMVSAPVSASIITIDFTATISNDGGTTTDDIFGQFVLDTNTPWNVDAGTIGGVITSATFTSSMFGSYVGDVGSAFTFAIAVQRTGYGIASLIAAYGAFGNFALDLTSDDFFGSASVFDALTADLSVGGLRSFDPGALETTRFVNLIDGIDEWEGALTSLSIVVPEPSTLWLMFLMLPAIAYWRRRA